MLIKWIPGVFSLALSHRYLNVLARRWLLCGYHCDGHPPQCQCVWWVMRNRWCRSALKAHTGAQCRAGTVVTWLGGPALFKVVQAARALLGLDLSLITRLMTANSRDESSVCLIIVKGDNYPSGWDWEMVLGVTLLILSLLVFPGESERRAEISHVTRLRTLIGRWGVVYANTGHRGVTSWTIWWL